MQSWKIREHVLEYDDELHQYLVDGKIVKSVTQLIHNDKYNGIPKAVLNKAAERGTRIHSVIEDCGNANELPYEIEDDIRAEVNGWFNLKQFHKFEVIQSEMPIIIPYKDELIAAGRFDLLLRQGTQTILADIKTTSKLYRHDVTLQLSLYNRGLAYSYGHFADRIMAIHLKGDKHCASELIPVDDEADEILRKEYERCREELDLSPLTLTEIPL